MAKPIVDIDTYCFWFLKTFNMEESYRAAGGTGVRNASRYHHQKRTQDRIGELAVGVVEKLKSDDQNLIRSLKKELVSLCSMVIGDIGHVETHDYTIAVLEEDEDGKEAVVSTKQVQRQQFKLKPWEELSREQMGLIKSIQTKPDGTIKVDTYDRLHAIKLLGELLHAFKEVAPPSQPVAMAFSRTYQGKPPIEAAA